MPDWFPEIAGDPQQAAVNAELTAGKWSRVANRPYRYDVFLETDFQAVRQQYSTAMGTLHLEFMWRIITGQGDLDAEWDGHVERFMNSGGSALIVELKKAPIVPELEMGKKVIGP